MDRKLFKRIETRHACFSLETSRSELVRFDSRKPSLRTKNGYYGKYVCGQLLVVDCSGNACIARKGVKNDAGKEIGKILKGGDYTEGRDERTRGFYIETIIII